MPDVILHHYPQSPVAEKVRTVLGIKDLDWHSVEIPRLPPKPDLIPLTGGYRRTPVMQVGADIYCDSQCIIRELERRFPEPTLFPGGSEGLAWGISRWTDGPLFTQMIGVVLGAAEKLPPDFAADRGRLYFGESFQIGALQEAVAHNLVQIRGQLLWLEQHLATGRGFIPGPEPGLADALCYYLIWFIRGRYAGGPDLLSEFPNLEQWESRIAALGHGRPVDMDAADALELAKTSDPDTPLSPDPSDPGNLTPGMKVSIVPDGDGGDPSVSGDIISINAAEIAIMRRDERVGEIIVHFPRVGYQVTMA